MPLPTTDEQLITTAIDDLKVDLLEVLERIYTEVRLLREYAEQGRLPPSALLINEFMTYSDMDGGRGLAGSIYGRDFMIDPGDAELPPNLKAIHHHPEWPQTPPPLMSWQAYLSTWL